MKAWTKLEKVFLIAYGIWMTIGIVSMSLQISSESISQWSIFREGAYSFVQEFIGFCLRQGNPILMFLAAMNVYLMLIRHWGLSSARRWSLIVMVLTGVIEAVGAKTGYPFGDYFYTDQMGPRILGVLPISIPLAWLVVVSSSLIFVKCYFPEWGKWKCAFAVGVLATAFDYLMEPFAARAMSYWLWQTPTGLPPWQNYLSWFGLSFWLVGRYSVMRLDDTCSDIRPPVILGSMVFLFIVVRMVHGV